MPSPIFWLAPTASILALFFAWLFYHQMKKKSEGTERMAKIASYVRKGAMAYLKQQYKVVTIVFICLIILLALMAFVLKVQNRWVPLAFLTGGFFSGLAGFFGMKTATYASARTANAARNSLDSALKIAFRSGAVMGLTVVGLALLDISLWFLILKHFYPISDQHNLILITTTMLTFGMGASTQALFARVGGGIFTKAADVGADLVGKIESNIPEDDPRNPAVIADNVGDNVGDVAGMGADLYESYAGSILATTALGASAFIGQGATQFNAVIAPMAIAAVGTLLSILGIFFVKTKEGATQKDLINALGRGINASSALIIIFSYFIIHFLNLPVGVWLALVSGLLAGVAIGKSTEYFTSHSFKPTKRIAQSATTGAATVIIAGIGTGMLSTSIPVISVAAGTVLAYLFASNFNLTNVGQGLYGIGIA
ncbi:MAG: proton/sodium-translocating pyrophosphatase, partial [Candidatus Saccharicenans sp.]